MFKNLTEYVLHILNGIFFLFSCLIIFTAGFLLISSLLGFRPLIVLSGSMEPAIHTGSLIFINTKKTEASQGDIVTIDLALLPGDNGEISYSGSHLSRLITHRVVRRENDCIVTKGDANENEDLSHISPYQVIGTYAFQIPYAGYLIAYAEQLLPRKKK